MNPFSFSPLWRLAQRLLGRPARPARRRSLKAGSGPLRRATLALEALEDRLAPSATQLVITLQPPSSVAAGASFDVTVSAEDSSNNVDTAFTGDISLSGYYQDLLGTTTKAAVAG